MSRPKVTHICNEFSSLGGIQAVLRHHWETDSLHGLESRFVIYMEPERSPIERVAFLELDRSSTIHNARLRMRVATDSHKPDIAVYHGLWGLANLADLDGASRRLLIIHGDAPGFKETLHFVQAWIDGFLCVNELLALKVGHYLPNLDKRRIGTLPYPIEAVNLDFRHSPLSGRPLRIGFAGRLTKGQKRVDRLPVLCQHLDQLQVDFRLEFLGDGPARPWLEMQFENDDRVIFHGRRSGTDYWRILSEWDVIVFTSDYEGVPIAMIEALSQGVIPLFPDIDRGYQTYPARLDPDLVYPPGDLRLAAGALQKLSKFPEETIIELRSRCRKIVAPHLDGSYSSTFAAFVPFLLDNPRISTSHFPRRPFIMDRCPFGLIEWATQLKLRLLRNFTTTWRTRRQDPISGVVPGDLIQPLDK